MKRAIAWLTFPTALTTAVLSPTFAETCSLAIVHC
jgi:hypothetical protein